MCLSIGEWEIPKFEVDRKVSDMDLLETFKVKLRWCEHIFYHNKEATIGIVQNFKYAVNASNSQSRPIWCQKRGLPFVSIFGLIFMFSDF